MCAQRMLRSGLSDEIVQSSPAQQLDERQGALDLDEKTTSAERMICRLAHENAQLVARLARAGLPTAVEDPIDGARGAGHGRNSKPDPIAELAASFAKQVVHLSSIQTDHPDGDDAAKVNASIEMIAEDADALVMAVINDAEDHGLEATGPWLKIPLIETQAFEVPAPDPEAHKADYEYDRRQNS
jgi:hypothetical protein